MRINTNTSATNAARTVNTTNNAITKNMQKLSSGLRINSAADDSTGLVISEQMNNQIKGFDQAIKNSQQGISMLGTAEGAMAQQEFIVSDIRVLVGSANSGNMTKENLATTQNEITQLLGQINDIARNTEYNGKKLLDGSLSSDSDALVFQVGANAGQVLSQKISKLDATGLAIDTINVTTGENASEVAANLSTILTQLDNATKTLSSGRAELGAKMNRFDYTINNMEVSKQNLESSKSLITDVDMADEYVELSTNQVLQQVSTSMLAQANQKSQSILTLLQG